MARVSIGGTDYSIPPLNFSGLERAWPSIEIAMSTLDPMKAPAAGINIVAAGLMESDNFDKTQFGIEPGENLEEDQIFERVIRFLKKKLQAVEIENVRICVEDIVKEAGLDKAAEGEPQAPLGEASPSPEIAATSSSSSPPPAAVEETTSSSANDTASQSTTNS